MLESPAHHRAPRPRSSAAPPRGRPRDPALDDAILDATLRLLADVGYQAMSIAAIAATAGVGRPAIYRRFASKADLVVAAVLRIGAGPEPDLPADPRLAVRALLHSTAGVLATPGGLATLGSLLAQERRDPELLEAFRRRVFDPRQDVVQAVLRRGIASGGVDAGADLDAVAGMLFGALIARAALGEPVDEGWIDRVLEQAWRGIAVAAGPATEPTREPDR
jgi:AcrR family transcriptional regulator